MTTETSIHQRRFNSTASTASSSASHCIFTDHPPRSHLLDISISSGGGNKVIGACSSCRRSKVKCEHDGTAPCKRCKNGGYECTFKPREMGSALLQGEWRIQTDETLSRLVGAIDALVQHQQEAGEEDSGMGRKRKAKVEIDDGASRYAQASSRNAMDSVKDITGTVGGYPASVGSHHLPSTSTSRYQPATGSTAMTPQLEAYLRSTSRRPSLAFGMDQAGPILNDPHTTHLQSSAAALDPFTLPPQAESSTRSVDSSNPIRAALKVRGSLPLPSIATIANNYLPLGSPLALRPSQYRFPGPTLGSADPRLDAIRLGLLPSHTARSLFSSYAKHIEPFSFCFPDFPSTSNLTPVLLSSIITVSSLLSTSHQLRSLHLRLRTDFLDRTQPYAPLSPSDEFNPESGIGTEEVIGACIFSTYYPSPHGRQTARAARWWSEKYSYESGPHAGLTVGEMVAILPPVRNVNTQDRVRVWLSAFIAELHQCEIHGREAIMEAVSPCSYAQSLQLDANGVAGTKQDACLVFYARIAYLVAKARETSGGGAEGLLELTRQVTKSWCETRALLGTEVERGRDTYDNTLDLHYTLAKASIYIRAHNALSSEGAGEAAAEVVTCSQACKSACLDSIGLLMREKAGFLGNLAALPAIYHYWIVGCVIFLLQLCSPERMFYRLGLVLNGEIDEVLWLVGLFMEQYVSELDGYSTRIVVEEGEEEEVMKHPAMEAALAVGEMLASVQATI
ncbi:uncharacterized protein UHOD_02562 [Ustilago sp. UG-2017b]|nr:uncharacterized protein UHOD_02562 [Ustilago sp. UG-2017b]